MAAEIKFRGTYQVIDNPQEKSPLLKVCIPPSRALLRRARKGKAKKTGHGATNVKDVKVSYNKQFFRNGDVKATERWT